MRQALWSSFGLWFLLIGCQPTEPSQAEPSQAEPSQAEDSAAGTTSAKPLATDNRSSAVMDIHSRAEPERVVVTHVALDLTADFDATTLSGVATLDLKRHDQAAPVVLDTQDLVIEAVYGADRTPRTFDLGIVDPTLGRALSVQLLPDDSQIAIHYRTSGDAAAVQWLAPQQTNSGTDPFLFTQGQAILTRSWIPLQDSPGVRVSYSATIRTPQTPELVAVMSAEQREVVEPGITRFKMTHPIPAYLIALAIGRLEARAISPRCSVWAEPTVVEAAAREFEDTESMLETSETLFGPYRWGRYDILVLPPAFPFGGMENPCLTFATPTILAGDKSLVALIAHELAHSWSGNLVTNATWRDFWLNEGFTVYLEQRIMEAVFGRERARMETLIGLQQLAKELRSLPASDQRLHIDLTGRNPDDGMTSVAYDKGAAFLRRLEEVFGRDRFDSYLTAYFDRHAFRSITTADFLADLEEHLFADDREKAGQVDIDAWVRGIGLPADNPVVESPAFAQVDEIRSAFADGKPAGELPGVGSWVTMQWLHFLENMPSLSVEQLADLDAAFNLTESGNSEILSAWFELNLQGGYDRLTPAVKQRLSEFLLRVGRRKFLKPLYESLAKTASGRAAAQEIYRTARPRYHAVATRTIDEILNR